MMNSTSAMADMSSMEILNDGVELLRKNFGDVKTEMFISIICRERFDYTKWRRRFFEGKSVHEINDEAVKYASEHPFEPQKDLLPVKRKES